MSAFDRLTALDASFLGIEKRGVHMHVGGVLICQAGPLRTDAGGIDFPKIRAYVDGMLDRIPRYRRRLARSPGLGHPFWVDDEHFRIDYHLRHTALPRPGNERILKRLAGRIFSQPLDRSRPLWEMWVVEGLEEDRFGVIFKIHHALVDGIAGAELMAVLFRATEDVTVPAPSTWQAREPPSGADMLLTEAKHRTTGSLDGLRKLGQVTQDAGSMWRRTRGMASILREGLTPASRTSLNRQAIGPHRRFDVCHFDLDAFKRIKNHHGTKLNDVVLSVTAGALARFLRRRGDDVDAMRDLRALVPVNIRKDAQQGAGGNAVATVLARLPVEERDPLARLAQVHEITTYLKGESGMIEGAELLEHISDLAAASIVREVFNVAALTRAFNIVVTNVPGPPFPLYLLGAQVEHVYPLVPLFKNQALGIALFSYDGKLNWGLHADWELVPDLHELVVDLKDAFDELGRATPG